MGDFVGDIGWLLGGVVRKEEKRLRKKYTDLPLVRLVARSFVSHRHHLCLSHSDSINALRRGSDSKGWACVWESNLRPPPAMEYESPSARCALCRGPRF